MGTFELGYYLQKIVGKKSGDEYYYGIFRHQQMYETREVMGDKLYGRLIKMVNDEMFDSTIIVPKFEILQDSRELREERKGLTYVSEPLIQMFSEETCVREPVEGIVQEVVSGIFNFHNREVRVRSVLERD